MKKSSHFFRDVLVLSALGLLIVSIFYYYRRESNSLPTSTPVSPTPTSSTPVPTTSSAAITPKTRPDLSLTPGSIMSDSEQQVCQPGYASAARSVTDKLKEEVYTRYKIFNRQTGQYEIDHLVALELGGSNNINNLWPIPTVEHKKFKTPLDNELKKLMCKQKSVTLKAAQIEIKKDWIAAHQKYIKSYPKSRILPQPTSTITTTPTSTTIPTTQPVEPPRRREPTIDKGCSCPYDINANGNPCKGSSAYARPNGVEPTCYESETRARQFWWNKDDNKFVDPNRTGR